MEEEEKGKDQVRRAHSSIISRVNKGAQDSTSARCALGTSTRVLRLLTESGDVIRYVFLLSAGVRQDKLDVGGGGRPVCSSWGFVRFGGR